MSEKADLKHFIEAKAYAMRIASLAMTTRAGSGHPSSCLSGADLAAALFLYGMHFDPQDFDNPNNDRFVLSKGHAAPLLYTAWKEVGVISESELMTYRDFDSALEGHPTRRFKYAEAATGSLGIGLSIGAGMSMAAKMDKRDAYTYVMLGDAEVAEGSIWEAAEIASHYKLNNLIAVLDCNRLGQSTESLNNHHLERYAHKFEAFGWHALIIDGHDMQQIMSALDKVREVKDMPSIIVAKTFKGHGVDLFENKEGFHGKVLKPEDYEIALQQLKKNFPQAAEYKGDYHWQPQLPQYAKSPVSGCLALDMPEPHYKMDEPLATRKAYGQALAVAGHTCAEIVSLDGDVKNSTFAEIFEAKFPERFIQCYVAEQNMVSMGVGLDNRKKVPFISTFAAFFSRAFDQIRMAAIGKANLRLVGSHCGVSIGQDGPSQMGLEDIAMMRTLPDSIVLYPCDAVSTYKLVGLMAQYNKGISYLRTTRMDTPGVYVDYEDFVIGGCKVLRQSEQDLACVIGAGITLLEALKAYDMLQQEGINIAVIDLYSVKPIDTQTILDVAKKAGNRVITVEDHYLNGGLGQAVAYDLINSGITVECLAVTQVPRSGKPEELLAWAGIDAAAIVKEVKTH